MTEEVIGPFRDEWRGLSNFSPDPAEFDGFWYPTGEHAFQAAKTLDPDQRMVVAFAGSPGEAKKLGRRLDLRPDWEDIKGSVMYSVLRSKFSRPGPAELLLATGEAKLVEYNWWHDNIWGDCICGRSACSDNGLNLLGRALHLVRVERQEAPRV